MRLSDQELELVSVKGASQGVILVSTKGPMEGASKVGEAEGAAQVAIQGSAKGASLVAANFVRKERSKTTKARTGHFKNFFMC